MSYIYCKKGHILDHVSGKNYYCHICDEKIHLSPKEKTTKNFYDAIGEMTMAEFNKRYGPIIMKWNEHHKEFLSRLS